MYSERLLGGFNAGLFSLIVLVSASFWRWRGEAFASFDRYDTLGVFPSGEVYCRLVWVSSTRASEIL